MVIIINIIIDIYISSSSGVVVLVVVVIVVVIEVILEAQSTAYSRVLVLHMSGVRKMILKSLSQGLNIDLAQPGLESGTF